MKTQKDNSVKDQNATCDNNKLDDALILLNPENYEGYAFHPAEDNKIRKVEKAIIKPWILLEKQFGFSIEIYFEGSLVFSSTSDTIRGAKQQFAFQCRKGSKWVSKNII